MSRNMESEIDTRKCITEVRKLKSEGYSVRMVVALICDAYKKHKDNEYLTQFDRFVLGLRYSEFYALGTSNEDYYLAEQKRVEYLNVLGLKTEEINKLCLEMYGLH